MTAILTIAQVDERLTDCLNAYQTAIDLGDWEIADAMYIAMDDLLDQRCHSPQHAHGVR